MAGDESLSRLPILSDEVSAQSLGVFDRIFYRPAFRTVSRLREWVASRFRAVRTIQRSGSNSCRDLLQSAECPLRSGLYRSKTIASRSPRPQSRMLNQALL